MEPVAYGPPQSPSQKPQIAGVLLIGAGILEIISAIAIWSSDIPSYGYTGIDLEGMVHVCGTIVFVLAAVALLGSYSAIRKDSFVLAISASIAGLLGVGVLYLGSVLSFVAMILIIIARDEFRR